MCRFQVRHHWLQVAIGELYEFMIFFAHPLLYFSSETEENHQKCLKSKKILNCFSHVSITSTPSPVPSQTSRVVSIYDIICSSSSFLLPENRKKPSSTCKNRRKPPAVSHMCCFQVYQHWYRLKIDELQRFTILFDHRVPFFCPKTIKNHQTPLKIKENLKLFLACVDFKLTCTDSISYVTDSIGFIYQLFIWSQVTPRKPAQYQQRSL